MIKQFANAIASILIRENVIEKDDADIYSYGVEQMMINAITFVTVGLLASIFDIWQEAIFFFLGLMPIRLVAGGYHANTPQRCNVLSLFVFAANMIFINLLERYMTKEIVIVICFLIVWMIFSYAPVDHKNRVLKNEEYTKSKRQSRLIALVLVGSCIGMAWIQKINQMITLSIMMGALTVSISLVIGSIVRGGERNEESAQKCS